MPTRRQLWRHFSSLLRPICCPSSLHQGMQIHVKVITLGLLPAATLETDLLLMYSRCSPSDLSFARNVFDEMPHKNMHSWNILLSSYVQNSFYESALGLLAPFLDSGLRPDHFTLPALCKACSGLGLSSVGTGLHCWAVKLGVDEVLVVRSTILDMYAKCGSLDCAYRLFVLMPERDVVVWNTMISGFARAGLLVEALSLLRRLQLRAFEMDWRAIPSILNACGREGQLMKGKEIHGRAIKYAVLDSDIAVANALVDMYAKCGCLHDALSVFLSLIRPNSVTWSTMISCLGVHGKGEESLTLYDQMTNDGFKPNSVTFTSVLSSCSHSGLIDDGRRVFASMHSVYNVEPTVEHYACMVDLLGRSGNIQEATRLIATMPVEPSASVWGALLAACAAHKNVEIGEFAAHKLFDLEPNNASNYMALCSIYVAAGMPNSALKIRTRMRELGMIKTPGCSWILMKGELQPFFQGNIPHPFEQRIQEFLVHLHSWITRPQPVR